MCVCVCVVVGGGGGLCVCVLGVGVWGQLQPTNKGRVGASESECGVGMLESMGCVQQPHIWNISGTALHNCRNCNCHNCLANL